MQIRKMILMAAATAIVSVPLFAGSVAGVSFEDRITASGHNLVLNGAGLRKKFIVKVYAGALYLGQKTAAADKVMSTDGPRRMVMHFLYSVSKDQMCEAWDEGLRDNTPNPSAEVKKDFNTLCSWMEAIPKGNRLVLTYVPGTGTQLEVNGKMKGTIPGKPFADAVLATWIGPKPAPGADFRDAVLGK